MYMTYDNVLCRNTQNIYFCEESLLDITWLINSRSSNWLEIFLVKEWMDKRRRLHQTCEVRGITTGFLLKPRATTTSVKEAALNRVSSRKTSQTNSPNRSTFAWLQRQSTSNCCHWWGRNTSIVSQWDIPLLSNGNVAYVLTHCLASHCMQR
jgi:hypothetical protein